MVYYKRKPVEFKPSPPPPQDEDEGVWYIKATDEFFTEMDFYNRVWKHEPNNFKKVANRKQRKFICELTGHSCLTYFEALESETKETKQVIENFPEALKEPILRRLQFSQISRLDALVDDVYNFLKGDFYPGEAVVAKVRDQRIRVIIREKAQINPVGEDAKEAPSLRYRVEMLSNSNQAFYVNHGELTRDRKIFTKVILRTFIKHSVTREAWSGAPWIVKPQYAEQYRLDQTMPWHLQRDAKASPTEKKKSKKKSTEPQFHNMYAPPGYAMPIPPPPPPMPPIAQFQQIMTLPQGMPVMPIPHPPPGHVQQDPNNFRAIPQPPPPDYNGKKAFRIKPEKPAAAAAATNGDKTPKEKEAPKKRGRQPQYEKIYGTDKPKIQEDLEYKYIHIKAKERIPYPLKHEKTLKDQTLIGVLLETWLFLNVYHEPLVLDSFTFDDFVEALKYTDSDTDCSLLDEIHCALLSQVVSTKCELLVRFPQNEEEDEEDEEEEEEKANGTQAKDEGAQEPEEEENEEEDGEAKNEQEEEDEEDEELEDEEEDEEEAENRAKEFVRINKQDWKQRLQRRAFKDGGWQQILIALLYQVSYYDDWKETCRAALNIMAPKDLKSKQVTLDDAYEGYFELPFELRIKVLDILCCLLHGTVMVRKYIDDCMEQSTRVRRERSEKQRILKALTDDVKTIGDEKRKFFPHGYSGLTDDERRGLSQAEQQKLRRKKRIDSEAVKAKEDEEFAKVFERFKVKYAEWEKVDAEVKKFDDELGRLDVQRLRMLGKDRYHNRYWWFESNGMTRPDRELADHREQLDHEDGGEEDVAGEEDEEDRPTGYAMGRLWVQGPSDEDAKRFLHIDRDVQEPQFKLHEGEWYRVDGETEEKVLDPEGNPVRELSILERKKLEEGGGFLKSLDNWGYYDKQEEIVALMAWFNRYGKREVKLAKNLEDIRGRMSSSMKSRDEDLTADYHHRKKSIEDEIEEMEFDDLGNEIKDDDDEEKNDDDDEADLIQNGSKRRRSSRRLSGATEKKRRKSISPEERQAKIDKAKEEKRAQLLEEMKDTISDRVLEWSNSMAADTLGHTHYEGRKPRNARKR